MCLKLSRTRWSHIKTGIRITWYDNVRLRKIVAKACINFTEIPLDKCSIVDPIQLGIQASICNGLSNYFISIDVSDPGKFSQQRQIEQTDFFLFLFLSFFWERGVHLLARVRPMVPVPQNRSRTISDPSPLRPAQSSMSLYKTSA